MKRSTVVSLVVLGGVVILLLATCESCEGNGYGGGSGYHGGGYWGGSGFSSGSGVSPSSGSISRGGFGGTGHGFSGGS